jgi:PIN domain nuclease of toxin-antitoxin system
MKELIQSDRNLIAFSPLSIWECRIKEAKGRLQLPGDLLGVIRSKDFTELRFTSEHADEAGQLPVFHSDPFDRGLVAQARKEDFTLVTHDRTLSKYEVRLEIL